MIAMSMTGTHDEDRRDAITSAPVYSHKGTPIHCALKRAWSRMPTPAHPLRRAMMHALAMFGLGMGGVAAVDDDEALGIG